MRQRKKGSHSCENVAAEGNGKGNWWKKEDSNWRGQPKRSAGTIKPGHYDVKDEEDVGGGSVDRWEVPPKGQREPIGRAGGHLQPRSDGESHREADDLQQWDERQDGQKSEHLFSNDSKTKVILGLLTIKQTNHREKKQEGMKWKERSGNIRGKMWTDKRNDDFVTTRWIQNLFC